MQIHLCYASVYILRNSIRVRDGSLHILYVCVYCVHQPFIHSFISLHTHSATALWAKKSLKTTETFSDLETSPYIHRNPIKYACSHNAGLLIQFVLASSLQHCSIYMLFVFLPSYLSSSELRGSSAEDGNQWIDENAYTINCINSILFLPFTVIVGYFVDKIGAMPFLCCSCFVITFVSPFLFYALALSESSIMNWFLQFVLVSACVPLWGCIYFWYISELLTDPRTRVTIYGVAYNLGAAVFGGTASLIGTSFVASMGPTNGMVLCGIWMSINAVVCISTVGYIQFCGSDQREKAAMMMDCEYAIERKYYQNEKWFMHKLDPINEDQEDDSESTFDSYSDSEFIHFTSSEEFDVHSKYSCDCDSDL